MAEKSDALAAMNPSKPFCLDGSWRSWVGVFLVLLRGPMAIVTAPAQCQPDRSSHPQAFEETSHPGTLRFSDRGLAAPEGGRARHERRQHRGIGTDGFRPIGEAAKSLSHRRPFLLQLDAVNFAFRDQQSFSQFERTQGRLFSRHARSFL